MVEPPFLPHTLPHGENEASKKPHCECSTHWPASGRREVLGAALGGAAVLLGAAPALAKDVGDGGLPEGMVLLQSVQMFQKQWKVLPWHRR